jgi:DNA-binding MarR family transcriptional regulator
MYTYGWVRGQISEILKPRGLTNQQYNVLRILRGSHPDPLSTSDIRERMLDKMSDASRIVDRLCKKELVERRVCATDKRLVDVFITEQGLEQLSQIDALMDAFHGKLQSLTEQEAETLNKLLDKLRD